jgi:hypothetical protein
VQRTRVNILGADGLRQFVLEEADSIQVTDPDLRARIGQALESLRREANQSLRHVTLRSAGDPSHGACRLRCRAPLKATNVWCCQRRMAILRACGLGGAGEQSGAVWDGIALTRNTATRSRSVRQSIRATMCAAQVPVEILGRIPPSAGRMRGPAEPPMQSAARRGRRLGSGPHRPRQLRRRWWPK